MSKRKPIKLTTEESNACRAEAIVNRSSGGPTIAAKDGNGKEVIRTAYTMRATGPWGPYDMAACATLEEGADLLIKPDDYDDLIVVLTLRLTERDFEMKGWIPVREGRRLGYTLGQYVFVPQIYLKDPTLLKNDPS